MVQSSNKISLLRIIFLVVFIVSSVILALMFVSLGGSASPSINPTPTEDPLATDVPETLTPGHETETQSSKVSLDMLLGTFLTSATSLIGFVTTTVITWRKEKRDAALADVERKKLETELEKSRLELENLKKNNAKKKTTTKKK
ncbi:MAG: hypothetical protein U0Z26_13080 [Anaerolineales bacterium]